MIAVIENGALSLDFVDAAGFERFAALAADASLEEGSRSRMSVRWSSKVLPERCICWGLAESDGRAAPWLPDRLFRLAGASGSETLTSVAGQVWPAGFGGGR
ncbi:MAG: hypothetical protein ACRDHU_00905 [Actinomycetota bacterium]